MIVRITGVPEDLPPGGYNVKFLRMCGDVAMYEFVPEQPEESTGNASWVIHS